MVVCVFFVINQFCSTKKKRQIIPLMSLEAILNPLYSEREILFFPQTRKIEEKMKKKNTDAVPPKAIMIQMSWHRVKHHQFSSQTWIYARIAMPILYIAGTLMHDSAIFIIFFFIHMVYTLPSKQEVKKIRLQCMWPRVHYNVTENLSLSTRTKFTS